ncbi:MAG: M48 family metallopeptidase [Spirochaetales bacterium]|nr:M48 family metallopeptidase [Spirochaetales bacterium]
MINGLFFILFLAGTGLNFVFKQVLEFIDFKFRQKHGTEIPAELQSYLEKEDLEKTVKYENENYFAWIPFSICSTSLSVFLVVSGYFPAVFEFSKSLTDNAYLGVLIFSVLTSIPSALLSIPFNLWDEFKIEKKYGFSNMTLKMFIVDGLKNALLNLVLSLPLLLIFTFILIHASQWWWILVSLVTIVFSLLVSYIYPVLLAPIFNKFTPLENEELKVRLEKLLEKCGFKASGIFQMDASKRSNHSNAYFTGFGKNKRIVLFDTLLKQLDDDEIEAVLGHELGHYKKHHIIKRMAVSLPLLFIAMFLISLLIKLPSLYTDFGFSADILKSSDKGAVAFLQLAIIPLATSAFEGFNWIVKFISNHFSRKDEFEADRFSAELCGSGKPLSSALIKLNKENLSEVQVPEIYSMFCYSHPPLMERINAVK